MAADIERLCKVRDSLKAERATWDSLCEELGTYVCPRKSDVVTKRKTPSNDKEARLLNSTAIECNMTLAHGQMSYAMPFSERWFSCEAPGGADDDAMRWYDQAGAIMAEAMGKSNFYAAAHEACIDRSGFGCGNLGVFESFDNESGLTFEAVPVGDYSITENAEGLIDTVYRDRQMTADQIVQAFGEESAGAKVLEAYKDPARRYKEEFCVTHAVFPRPGRDITSLANVEMPYASVRFIPEHKHLISESGYEDQPYKVSRYLKWGSQDYGWCPGWQALPIARQVNLLESLLDGQAEVALYPRMLIPATLEGEVDIRAGGMTIYNPFQGAMPQEWLTGGRYDVGVDRLERKEAEIRRAYHYDLFQMFAQLDKQMTAREVAERATEKLVLFSPTFVRMQEEWLLPILKRVFRILMRQGKFPDPPPSVVLVDRHGPHVRPPKLVFTSRISLAIRSLQSMGFMQLLEAIQPLMAIDPTSRHAIRIGESYRGLARNFGVPMEWIAPEDEFQAKVEAEIQQQQAAAQMQAAGNMIGTAAKLMPEQIQAVAGALGG